MKEELKRIEAKARLGLALTEREKAYYVVFSKTIDKEVVNGPTKI